MNDVKVVILCGGMGTRLKEETEFRPKPMIEIGGRPILWHIMKIYSAFGFNSFILCLGYKGSFIKEYFLNYEAMNQDFTIKLGPESSIDFYNQHDEGNWKVTLADTGLFTNTGGRIKKIEKYVQEEHFMITYGDGLADINIKDLFEFHKKTGKIGTLSGVRTTSRFGMVKMKGDACVGFREKPFGDNLVSGGFFVFRKDFFDYLDENCVLEKEPLEALANEGQLAVYKHHGFWKSMDTYRDYLEFNRMWEGRNTPWWIW